MNNIVIPDKVKRITVTPSDAIRLDQIIQNRDSSLRMKKRAMIIKLSRERKAPYEVSVTVKVDIKTVRFWCQRYINHGINGLRDAPRPGRKIEDGKPSVEQIEEKILHNRPLGGIGWNPNNLAKVFGVKPNVMYEMIKRYRIPLSKEDLMMKYYLQFLNPVSDVVSTFISPTLKAIAFQSEVLLNDEDEDQYGGNGNKKLLNIEDVKRSIFNSLRKNNSMDRPMIHLTMERTDHPGEITNLHIPISTQSIEPPNRKKSILSPPEIAFYYYKVEEFRRAIMDKLYEVSRQKCDRPFDMDFLVFLDCVDRMLHSGKEISLVMNSLTLDTEGRISNWLKKHPYFRNSSFLTDEMWLDIALDTFKQIQDHYKKHMTMRLEQLIKKLDEFDDVKQKQPKIIVCYRQDV